MQKLKTVPGSSPVYGELKESAIALVGTPPKGETSLQKLDGTNVYQWHYRTGTYWEPWGPLMIEDMPSDTE